MTKQILSAVLAVGLAGMPLLSGCDRKVAETETSKTNSDGSTTSTKHETTVDANGNTHHVDEKKTTPPSNP